MGVTIHYKGTIGRMDEIDQLGSEIIDIAETMGWSWTRLDEDFSKPCTATVTFRKNRSSIVGHIPLKGVAFQPHEFSEIVMLYFDSEGKLNDPLSMALRHEGKIKNAKGYLSVKTQFAPIDTHIAIVKLFRYLKKRYIPDLDVYDEGGYWETNDVEELQRRISSVAKAMDILNESLSSLRVHNRSALTAEQIATKIEDILQKRFRIKKRRRKRL